MPKGTTLTSYDPSLRDNLAWMLSDLFGGDDRGRRNWINSKVRGVADVVPGVGEAVGIDETKRAFDAGNYGEAALGAAGTTLGAIPGGGDIAAAGLKGAAGILGPMSNKWRDVFHGTFAPEKFELSEGIKAGVPTNRYQSTPVDAGIHVTDDPALAASYAGLRLTGAPPDEML